MSDADPQTTTVFLLSPALLQRIHPAASRVKKLASETPGLFIAFDLLVDDRGKSLTSEPLAERRLALETFAAERFDADGPVRLSPTTRDARQARK